MIRKAIIVVLTLGAVVLFAIDVISDEIFVIWQSHEDASRDMTILSLTPSHLSICHGSLCRGCRNHIFDIRWYLGVPLWLASLVLAAYPSIAFVRRFLRRAKRQRYVERDWFAVLAGMSAFALAVLAIYFVRPFEIRMDRLFGSDAAAIAVVLVILVSVPAICAIVVHNVIVGPLRGASLRERRMCVVCSYDLTGNVSGRCSECGTEFDPSTFPSPAD